MRILWLGLQRLLGHPASAIIRCQKRRVAVLSRGAVRAMQELVVVQEELRRENSLGVELLVEIARSFGGSAHRVSGIALLVREKIGARALEIQFVQTAKTVIEQGGRGWRSFSGIVGLRAGGVAQ